MCSLIVGIHFNTRTGVGVFLAESSTVWPILPGIDQVLSQADTGVGASDGDLSVSGAFHRVGNLDLSARHLTDLVDLCTLAADDAADELWGGGGGVTNDSHQGRHSRAGGAILLMTYIVWNGQLMRASLSRGVHPSWGAPQKQQWASRQI